MKELRNGIKIIGIDHGYGNIKTAGTVTPTGITPSSTEPVFAGNILHYDGMYYRMGEGHKEFIPDKVQDNDFYLFTLMAIARELSKFGIHEADVHIAAGLPLTWVKAQRESFRTYLTRNPEVRFTFRDKEYHIHITGCSVFPQGYTAVVDRLSEMTGVNMLADIGNGTMNIMYINNKKPVESKCYTEKLGVNQCMIAAKNAVLDRLGIKIDEVIVEQLPEEDSTKHFLISLIFQQLYREILTVADEKGGALDKRVMFYMDEVGTLPKIDGLEMIFSASRSRKVSIVAIIQSLAQFEKTYGKEGAEIIVDNCQCTLFGAFAPNSKTAEAMSQNLGKQTVLSGTVTRSTGNGDANRQLQMIERPLMTVDELKSMPKGHFIVMKTGCHPMKTRLKLFFKWGIVFEDAYSISEKSERKVQYADSREVEAAVLERFPPKPVPIEFMKSFEDVNPENVASIKRSPKTRKNKTY